MSFSGVAMILDGYRCHNQIKSVVLFVPSPLKPQMMLMRQLASENSTATISMQLQQQLLSHPKLHCPLLQKLSQISLRLHFRLLLGLMHMLLMM